LLQDSTRLLGGDQNTGSICAWDLRRPHDTPVVFNRLPGRGSINQLAWIDGNMILALNADGFVSGIKKSNGSLEWRAEVEFEWDSGYRAELVRTPNPLVLLPSANGLYGLNANTGEALWHKPSGIGAIDQVIYNEHSFELLMLGEGINGGSQLHIASLS
jgi:outer membrane protein assembly factor BamB